MTRTTYLSGLTVIALLSACSKLPGVGTLGGRTGSGSGGGSEGSAAPVKVTPTPEVSDEEPFEIRMLARRARALEAAVADRDADNLRKQLPDLEGAIDSARTKFPDRDYAPYEKLVTEVEAALAALTQGRADKEAADRRWWSIREEFEQAIRLAEPNGALSPGAAVAVAERLAALAARCKSENLPATYEGAAATCADVAKKRPYAQAAADDALATVTKRLDSVEAYKIPQGAKGEVWFDNRETGFLDAVAWVEPTLVDVERLIAVTGATGEVAAARARAIALAAAFEAALTAAAKRDTAPRGMLTSKSITASAVAQTGQEGTVIRAGVDKASVRPVKNDFGVVTGKSGTGYVVYQPPGKAYCFVRAYQAGAEADGANWQLWTGEEARVEVSRCK